MVTGRRPRLCDRPHRPRGRRHPTLPAMNHDPNPPDSRPAGLGGSLRAVAALCVLVLAVTGALVVLEVIPRSLFAEVGGKLLAVGGIAAVAVIALGLLSRR